MGDRFDIDVFSHDHEPLGHSTSTTEAGEKKRGPDDWRWRQLTTTKPVLVLGVPRVPKDSQHVGMWDTLEHLGSQFHAQASSSSSSSKGGRPEEYGSLPAEV
ncbi:hypothetical protein AND_009126 [Anopheles darlingi]|uniref:Uncharacterized protein n=1 Tax=Anopheles darlingi TaxID=43151 RepID=W5J7C3_ANODA|nr:hypothetical protein AND_009126 [Anopheles darlingi]